MIQGNSVLGNNIPIHTIRTINTIKLKSITYFIDMELTHTQALQRLAVEVPELGHIYAHTPVLQSQTAITETRIKGLPDSEVGMSEFIGFRGPLLLSKT